MVAAADNRTNSSQHLVMAVVVVAAMVELDCNFYKVVVAAAVADTGIDFVADAVGVGALDDDMMVSSYFQYGCCIPEDRYYQYLLQEL